MPLFVTIFESWLFDGVADSVVSLETELLFEHEVIPKTRIRKIKRVFFMVGFFLL